MRSYIFSVNVELSFIQPNLRSFIGGDKGAQLGSIGDNAMGGLVFRSGNMPSVRSAKAEVILSQESSLSVRRSDPYGIRQADSVTGPNRIYSARELLRRVEEPGPFHNFPEAFNSEIFSDKRTVVSDRYVLYTKEGGIVLPGAPIYGSSKVRIGTDRPVREIIGFSDPRFIIGTYEIGVRPSLTGRTEVITHRFFRAKDD